MPIAVGRYPPYFKSKVSMAWKILGICLFTFAGLLPFDKISRRSFTETK